MKTNKFILAISVVFQLLFLTSCFSNSNKSEDKQNSSETSNAVSNVITSDVIVYQSTEPNKTWVKFEMNNSNNTYKYWITIPSAGEWGEPKYEGTFKIEETRGTDTGKLMKVYRFSHGEENPMEWDMLILSGGIGGEIAMSANPNYARLIAKETNENPWK